MDFDSDQINKLIAHPSGAKTKVVRRVSHRLASPRDLVNIYHEKVFRMSSNVH